MAELIVVMGPSGCGKSTLASAYAGSVGCAFVEGDDYHPQENIARMRTGQPLDDSDRILWLDRLLPAVNGEFSETVVLACSALTPFVQQRIRSESLREVVFLYCHVPAGVLQKRLANREGHFMPPELLASQLKALALPDHVVQVDANAPIETVLEWMTAALKNKREK